MSKIKWIIPCVCTLLAMVGISEAKGWRGLVPLRSTRGDVERLLGAARESHGVASTYDTRTERVLVFYSAGRCKEGARDDWNVPPDTVVNITVHPIAELLVDDLKLDKMKYERVDDYHVHGVVYYFSKEEGVRISARVRENGREDVDSITYEPTTEDSHLRCTSSSVHQTGGNEREYLISKFDEYSDIPFGDEKARLDNFAIYLQKDEPTFKGYIIVYAGRSTRSLEAQVRAKRAKRYLVEVRGLKAARVVTIYGGYREQLEVELYALPLAISPPTPNPDWQN